MKKAHQSREKKIEFIKRKLLRDGLPRVQISLILALTAVSGFLASFAMLRAGISSMTFRYPVAIAAAYCVFLLLLRVWLWLQKNRLDADLTGLDFVHSPGSGGAKQAFNFGGGGDFAGGGGGVSWTESASASGSAGGDSLLESVDFDLDSEGIGLLILAFVAVIGAMLAAFYVVYIAPLLLAEILVDGVLVAGLYNRVKGIERRYWLKTAVKRTIIPAVLAVIFFSVAGYALQALAPEARSIGEVWKSISS